MRSRLPTAALDAIAKRSMPVARRRAPEKAGIAEGSEAPPCRPSATERRGIACGDEARPSKGGPGRRGGDLRPASPPLDALAPGAGPFGDRPATVDAPAGRALTTAELRAGKPDRRAFLAQARLPVRVVLDGVRQGYNVGALFRLCDAFLCERLVVCGRDGARGARKLVQAAQGTHNWVPWEQRDCAADAVRDARAGGWQVVAVEQTSGAVGLDRFAPRRPVCLVLGSERAGVSRSVLDLADAAVAIPMRGMANSLNVATAAAIVLHALTAAHAAADGDGTP